jgi:voltage-gated potassium channel Kch
MQIDRYFWIALARVVAVVIAFGIFIVGLGRVSDLLVDALITRKELLIGIGIVSIGGVLYAAGVLAWHLVGLASEMADDLRSKAE